MAGGRLQIYDFVFSNHIRQVHDGQPDAFRTTASIRSSDRTLSGSACVVGSAGWSQGLNSVKPMRPGIHMNKWIWVCSQEYL